MDEDIAVLDHTDIDDDEDVDFEEPKDWALIYLNDNYTPFEFVSLTLEKICHKSHEEAEQITLQVHKEGKGIGYIGVQDIVCTKRMEIMMLAKECGFPLKIEIQEM